MFLGYDRRGRRALLQLTLATIATGVVVGIGACVQNSPEERAVEGTVDAFLDALGHDGETACLQLSREAQAQLTRRKDASSCERAAESTARRDLLFHDIGEIRFVGPGNQRAYIPHLLEGEDFDDLGLGLSLPRIWLEQGDGRWRITGIAWYFE